MELARQPFPRLWQAIWGPEPNMELYYLLLHFWLQLTALLGQDPTEFIARLPSALCAAFSVPVVFFAQIVAAAGLLILPGPWLAAAQRNWKMLGSAFFICILLSIPMALASRHGSRTGWLPVPHLHDLFNLLPIMINGSHFFSFLIIFIYLAAIILIPLSYLFAHRPVSLSLGHWHGNPSSFLKSQDYVPILWLLLCWLLLPIFISFVVSQGSTRLYSARYLIVIVPALCLLIALGIVALRIRVVQFLLVCILLYLTFSTAQNYYPNAQIEDWRTAAVWLQQHYQEGDGLICYDNIQGCQTAMEYYFAAYPISQAHFTNDSPGNLHSWQTDSGFAAPGTSADAALNATAIATYAQQHSRIFYIVGRVSGNQAAEQVSQAEAWMNSHYHLIGQIESTGNISVRLYQVKGTP